MSEAEPRSGGWEDLVPRVARGIGLLILVITWIAMWSGLAYTTWQIQNIVKAAIILIYSIVAPALFFLWIAYKRRIRG